MKETLNGLISHSDGYCKETDSLSINMKSLQHFNRIGKEADNSVLLKREEVGFWTSSELEHSKFGNHGIKDMESGGRGSPNENDLREVLDIKPGTKGSKRLTPDEENSYKLLNGPEFERMMAPNDSANNYDEHELSDSGAQSITSTFFQADSTLYTDKSITECDVPQLIVCCKDIDCQHVKDICVDKGGPHEKKGSIDKQSDNFVGPHISSPSMDYRTNESTGNLDYEFHIPDRLTSTSDLTANRCEAEEESKVISPVPSEPECLPADKVKENGPNSEAFMQASEKNVGNKIEKCVLVEEPLEHTAADSGDMSDAVNEKPWKAEDLLNHNYQNFINPLSTHVDRCADMDEREEGRGVLDSEFRNSDHPFLVSEIQSSGKHGSTIATHHETLLTNMEGHSSNPFGVEVESAIDEMSTEEILPTATVNHKKENFNQFASSEGETLIIVKDTENIYQLPAESPKRRSTNNPFADCEVENSDMDPNCEGIDQQPELTNNKIADTNNPFPISDIHSSSEAKGIQHSNEQPELNHKGNSYNPFTDPELDDAGDTNTVIVPELQSLDLRDLHNHDGGLRTVSSTFQGGAGIGETSFSAVSGRITYSGPITISGSTSLRSDSSATSTRSFAFPILQSEWNSSPVRMKRAGQQKQRGGWKHSILCCKF